MRPEPSAALHRAVTILLVVMAATPGEAFASWRQKQHHPLEAAALGKQQPQLRRHRLHHHSATCHRPRPTSALQRGPSAASSSRLFLSDEPSDTSSDSFYDDDGSGDGVVMTVESESFSPTDAEALVTSVLDLIPSLATAGSEEGGKRAEINEALLKLEALNPTARPAMSPLLNGVWEL
jgi:hypothetical protein